jgi:hypothetical protein
MNTRAPLTLRVNPLKITSDKVKYYYHISFKKPWLKWKINLK